jgi:hypothetical protein
LDAGGGEAAPSVAGFAATAFSADRHAADTSLRCKHAKASLPPG